VTVPRVERRARVTNVQRARRDAVNARNAAIQQAGPKPADGITFAKGKREKRAK
jgi:hypothetical protein